MPPKRKSAVATRQPGRRTTRSEQRAVDGCGSSSGTQSGPRLDPFARVNGDIVNLILYCLSLPDLACCECVSKSWRDTIHWWVAAFGFRVHFPHIILGLQRRSDPAICEAFKVLARQQHGIRSGKLSSMQEFNFLSYHHITVVGKFSAGLVSPTQNESFVTWHKHAIPGGAVVNTKTFSLKKVWRVQVALIDLEMNQDGILLLRLLRLLRLGEAGKTHARSAVYSPIDGKTVWRQDHRHYNPKYGVAGELTPILIGRSVLHCARRGSNRDKFDLVGIDFRAHESTLIYESSAVRPKNWPDHRTCRQLLLMGGQHELVLLSDTENWVGTGRISILNGENGQLLFQFDGGPAHFSHYHTLACPTINQLSIQSVPSGVRLRNAVQHLEGHAKPVLAFIIIQTFSFAFSGSDSNPIDTARLSADVVLSPYRYFEIAIQPFAKVAVTLQSDGNTVESYPLVETKETRLIQMAEAVLKESIPPDSVPPTLRHCFVLQEPGTKISRRASLSSPLSLRAPAPTCSIKGFVDGGRLLLQDPEAQYLLEF